jgi:hypothetical protein
MIGATCRSGRRDGITLLLLLLFCAAPAAAQDPPPRPPVRDTLREPPRDTLPRAVPDSLPRIADEPDSVPPAVRFPLMPISRRIAAAGTAWIWDRERLLREADISLIDLLERIPGITTLRAGMFAQPEAAALFGGTAARVEIEIDGFVLDPLAAPSFDLAQITLGQLRELRVERRLGLLRIVMFTEYAESGEPYTRVEAGIGVPAANMFRGQFLLPHVIVGPLALGIERIDTDGINRREPAGVFGGWVKWAWTNGARGVQVELLRNSLRREPDSPWQTERVRQDLVLRARNRFTESFAAEVYAGRSQVEETVPLALEDDLHFKRESVQAGVRAGLALPWTTLEAAVRYRSRDDLPRTEAVIDADLALGPLLVGALGSMASWQGAETTSFVTARAEVGRLFGAGAFGEVTMGTRRAPLFDDDNLLPSLLTEREGWRAGVSLDLGPVAGSVAVIRLDQGAATPFGLPFDSIAGPIAAGAAEGIEAHGRIAVWRNRLTLSSWLTDWQKATGWAYLPGRSWRTALELHWLPLPSGNLEIFGRAEAHMRGSMLAFEPTPVDDAPPTRTTGSFTTADTYLQIRVIDVRIFVRWEDILGADIQELPDRVYRGPRVFYGVKWNLWN